MQTKMKAFSILEISIVLLIIGILTTSIFKGFNGAMKKVKMNNVVQNIRLIEIAAINLTCEQIKNSTEKQLEEIIKQDLDNPNIFKSEAKFTIKLEKNTANELFIKIENATSNEQNIILQNFENAKIENNCVLYKIS